MQSNELLDFAVEAIGDMKGRDLVQIDVRERSSITDYMVICSGNSKRHVQSIGEHVHHQAKHGNIDIIGMEGNELGEWVLVDLGSVIVHVLQESTREFYQLEKLWGE